MTSCSTTNDSAGPDPGFKYDVYVCHDEEDRSYAKTLLEFLESPDNGNLKAFHEERDGLLGRTNINTIDYAINNSRHIILLLSRNSLSNNWFELKVHASVQHRLDSPVPNSVIPVYLSRFREMGIIPATLRTIAGIEYDSDPNSYFWKKLLKSF